MNKLTTKKDKLESFLRWSVVVLLFVTPLLRNSDWMEAWPLKWISVFLASFLAAAYLTLNAKLELPIGRLWYAILAVVGFRIFSTLWFPNWMSEATAVESICFVVLAWFFICNLRQGTLDVRKFFWLYIPSTLFIQILSFVQIYNFRYKMNMTDLIFVSSTFGNINMMCQYLIFTTPLGFYFANEFKGFKSALAWLVSFFSILLLFEGSSRSALLGLTILFILLVIRRTFWKEAVCILVAFLVHTYAPTTSSNQRRLEYVEKIKVESLSFRTQLYKGALRMMAVNPLGVGAKNFDFTYAPYQMDSTDRPTEMVHYETPHSEFLKWGTEGGWGFFVAEIFFWLTLCWIAFRTPFTDRKSFLAKASCLVLMPEIAFQFPFDLGAAYFYMAFAVAMVINYHGTRPFLLNSKLKILMGVATLVILVHGTAYALSNYFDANYIHNELPQKRFACEIYPNNWHACINYGRILALSPQPLSAVPVLKRELERHPYNWVALKLLTLTFFQVDDRLHGCEAGVVYSLMMFGEGESMQTIAQRCIGVQSPVIFQDPRQFQRDYEAWLTWFLSRI